MDLIFARMTTWLAPILVFTTEEVWLDRFPGDGSSVHLRTFPDTPATWRDEGLAARWARVFEARRAVLGALEVERRDKRIGAALEAAPAVHVSDPALLTALEGVDLADLCIASAATVTDAPAPEGAFRLEDAPGVAVVPTLAQGDKCARCWKILPDVGTHAHPGVCGRCDAALAELGR
jgi:isoleucyl-tRNA synthetase